MFNKHKTEKSYFYAETIFLVLLSAFFFSPSVFATDYTASLSVSSTVAVNVAPELSGNDSVGISSGSITASTTCPAGYNIQIATTVSDPKLYLNGNTANASSAINPVSGTSLASGTYGYSLTSTTASGNDFHALSYDGTLLKNTSTSGSSTFNVYFGVKVSKSLALGTYQMTDNGSITYYMTMDPTCLPKTLEEAFEDAGKVKEIANDGNAYYRMQDMSGDICDNTNILDENSALQLVDSRDGKLYWVTKLQDNHCWMTQNLDLDLMTSVELSSRDTDLNNTTPSGVYANGYSIRDGVTYWKPATATIQHNGDYFDFTFPENSTSPVSINPGEYYINIPKSNTFTDIGTTPFELDGTHGSMGNFYNWTAAIASNDSSNISNNSTAGNSICPAGWRLPLAIKDDATLDGSTSEYLRLSYLYDGGTSGTYTVAAPFFYSPFYSTANGSANIHEHGLHGTYWTSFNNGNLAAFSFITYGDVAYDDYYSDAHSSGYGIRCVARDGEDARTQTQIDEEMAKAGKVKVVTADGARHYKMQDMRNSICEAVTDVDSATQTKLVDYRDGKTYWVAKYQDGHCWMTQNLDLDLDSTKTYTYLDTDLGWGGDKTTMSWQPERSTIHVNGSTYTGWTNDVNNPYSLDVGDWYYAGYDENAGLLPFTNVNYLTSGNKVTTNGVTTVYDDTNHTNAFYKSTAFIGTGTSNNEEHGHLGNYYNWTAAIASNDSSEYTASTESTITDGPQNSICPAGWRLVMASSASATTQGSTNEFSRLNRLYNNASPDVTKLEDSPIYFTRGGYINGNNLTNPGLMGDYWSSMVRNANYGVLIRFQSGSINTGYGNNRSMGRFVRCIARSENAPNTLYGKIANLVKTSNNTPLTQTSSDLRDIITIPTSNDPATDTSNSGVYLYDASTYGTASDASNSFPIYYYRGILDSNLDNTVSTYGSNGDGAYYPNYVILSSSGTPSSTDTCWRIVRTTGSGGVKMIYNGLYGATNTNSCANAQDNAATTYNGSNVFTPFNFASSTFAGKTYTGLQQRNIHAVGYTYSNLAAGTTTATAISTIFGSTGNDTTTNVNSSMTKQYIEDWYDANLSSYTSILEPDAGFCSDRTVGEGTSWTTPMSDSDTIIPYGTSNMTQYYFGSYIRNQTTGDIKKPTLSCPRGTVDIYSTSDATGGNKQLSRPIALLTIDEIAFAGNGYGGRTSRSSYSSSYSFNSYLRSGSSSWLLSPSSRNPYGNAFVLSLYADGNSSSYNVGNTVGVRPAISLKPGTGFVSGSGTATDPWVVIAP